MFAKFAVLSKFCKGSNIETIGLRRIFQYDCGSKLSNRMLFTNCPTNALIKAPILNVSSSFCKRNARLNIAYNMSSRSNKETLENAEKPRRPAQKHSKRLERRNKLKGLKTSHICCSQRLYVMPISTENQPCLKVACNMSSSHKGEDKGHNTEVGNKGKKLTPESKKKFLRKLRFKGIKTPHMNCKRCKMNKILKEAKAQNDLIKPNTDLGLEKEKGNVLESTNNQDISESQLPSKKVHVEFMESQNLKDFNINKSPQLPTVDNNDKPNIIGMEIKPINSKIDQTALIDVKKPIINLRTQNLKKSKNMIGASKKITAVIKPDVAVKTTTETVKSVAKVSNIKDNYKNSKTLTTPVVNIISLAREIKLNRFIKSKCKKLPIKIKNKLNKFAMKYNFKKYKALASKALIANIKIKEEKILENANKAASKHASNTEIKKGVATRNTSESIPINLSTKVPKTLLEDTKNKEENVVPKNANTAASNPLSEVKKDEAPKEASENESMNPNLKDNYHKSKPSIENPIVTSNDLAEGIKLNLNKFKLRSKKRLAKIKHKQKMLRCHLEKYKILASKILIDSSKVKNENILKDANGADDKQISKSLIDLLIERNTLNLKSQSKTKSKSKSRILTLKLKNKTKKGLKKFATKTLLESKKDEANTEVEAEKVESNPKIFNAKDQEIKQSTFGNNKLILPAENPLEKTVELKLPKKTNTVKIFYRPHPRRIKMLMEQRKKLEQMSQMQLNLKEEPETSKDVLIKNDVEPLQNIEFEKNAATVKEIDLPKNMEAKGKTVLSDALSTLLNTTNAPKMKIITNPNKRIVNKLKRSKKCVCGDHNSATKSFTDEPKNNLLLSGKTEKLKDEKGKVNADVKMPQLQGNKSAAIIKTNKLMKFNRTCNTRTRVNILKDIFKDKLITKETNKENILNNVTDSILNSTNDTKFKIIINPSEDVMNNMNISEQGNELPKDSLTKPSSGSSISDATSDKTEKDKPDKDKPESFLAYKVNEEKSKLEPETQILGPILKANNSEKTELPKDLSNSEKDKLLPSIGMVLANNTAAVNKLELSSTVEATTAKPQELKKPENLQNGQGLVHISKVVNSVLSKSQEEKLSLSKEATTAKPQELKKPENLQNGEGFVHISRDVNSVLSESKEEKLSPSKGQSITQSTFGNNYLTVPAKNSLDKSLELKVPKKTNAIKILDRPHPKKIKMLIKQRKMLEQKLQTQLNLKKEPKTVKPTVFSSASDKHSEADIAVSANRNVLNVTRVQPVAKVSSKKYELGSDISGTESDNILNKFIKAETIYQTLKAKVDAIMFKRMLRKSKLKNQRTETFKTSKFSKSIRSRIGGNSNGNAKGDGSGEKSQGQKSSKKASSSIFWNPVSLTLMPFLLGLTIYVMANVGFIEMFKSMQNKKPSEKPLSKRLMPAYYKNNSRNKKLNLIETDSDENDDKDDDEA